MKLSPEDRAKIEGENALALLKIKPRVTGHNIGRAPSTEAVEIF